MIGEPAPSRAKTGRSCSNELTPRSLCNSVCNPIRQSLWLRYFAHEREPEWLLNTVCQEAGNQHSRSMPRGVQPPALKSEAKTSTRSAPRKSRILEARTQLTEQGQSSTGTVRLNGHSETERYTSKKRKERTGPSCTCTRVRRHALTLSQPRTDPSFLTLAAQRQLAVHTALTTRCEGADR